MPFINRSSNASVAAASNKEMEHEKISLNLTPTPTVSKKEQQRSLISNNCSLKGALMSRDHVKSIQDSCFRVATSARAMTGIKSQEKNHPPDPIHLYLFSWRNDVNTALEYRVSLPFTGCEDPSISISTLQALVLHHAGGASKTAQKARCRHACEILRKAS